MKMFFQKLERRAGRLILSRRILLQPCCRSCKDEPSAGGHEIGKTIKKELRRREPTKQIRRVDEIKLTKIGAQIHRIPDLKGRLGRFDGSREIDEEFLRKVHFPEAAIANFVSTTDFFRDANEAGGKIDADDLAGKSGQFKSRPPYGAAQIESPLYRGRELGCLHRRPRELQASRREGGWIEADPIENLVR